MAKLNPEEALKYLRWRRIGDCTRCDLHRSRKHVVFGEGDSDADVMFIGEAPGVEEDHKARPFVGPSGTLLTWFIEQVGLRREQVYIANVLKCRPPENRDPEAEEIEACAPFLHTQIWLVQPKVIVALGRFAGNLLTGEPFMSMGKLRTGLWTYENAKTQMSVPIVPTYHPTYVLRKRGSVVERQTKLKVISDLQKALRYVEEGDELSV